MRPTSYIPNANLSQVDGFGLGYSAATTTYSKDTTEQNRWTHRNILPRKPQLPASGFWDHDPTDLSESKVVDSESNPSSNGQYNHHDHLELTIEDHEDPRSRSTHRKHRDPGHGKSRKALRGADQHAMPEELSDVRVPGFLTPTTRRETPYRAANNVLSSHHEFTKGLPTALRSLDPNSEQYEADSSPTVQPLTQEKPEIAASQSEIRKEKG
jgi:hypothetical protein